jgi:hypothetical protein
VGTRQFASQIAIAFANLVTTLTGDF